MYLKVRTRLGGETTYEGFGVDWTIFGGIRHLRYCVRNDWTWEEYQKRRAEADYSTGPTTRDGWYKNVASDGKRMYAYALINFEDGSNTRIMWHLVAYLLNEEGKTIETINAVG